MFIARQAATLQHSLIRHISSKARHTAASSPAQSSRLSTSPKQPGDCLRFVSLSLSTISASTILKEEKKCEWIGSLIWFSSRPAWFFSVHFEPSFRGSDHSMFLQYDQVSLHPLPSLVHFISWWMKMFIRSHTETPTQVASHFYALWWPFVSTFLPLVTTLHRTAPFKKLLPPKRQYVHSYYHYVLYVLTRPLPRFRRCL